MRKQHPKPRHLGKPIEKPQWDRKDQNLIWKGRIIKHFKAQAPHQEALLDECATQDWSPSIALQFPRGHPLHGKDRRTKTVENLNKSVKPHLHFRLERSATRLRWEIL